MERAIFTSANGDVIRFDGPPYHLIRINGLGDVGANIQLQKSPFQDGSTRIDSTLEERPITIEFLIVCESYQEVSEARVKLSRAFNPKFEGVLRYENDFVVREIKASAESVPVFPDGNSNRTETIQKGLINLICPNPYWLSEEETSQLVVWEGGLEFPLQLPTEFARQSVSKAQILLNEGDADTPIEVTFNGPATSPIKVINDTTGEYITVNQSLLSGERLEINTTFGQKKVTKVLADGSAQNAFHFITLGSTFFQLVSGNNLIDYSTGADYERAGVTISWHNLYLSV